MIKTMGILAVSIFLIQCWGKPLKVVTPQEGKKLSNKFIDNSKQKKYHKSINFAITESKGEAQDRYAFKPYVDYIAEKLEINVRLFIVKEYSDLERDMASGAIHIADFPAVAFVRAYDNLRGKIKYLGTYTRTYNGVKHASYRGIIFSRNDSNIKTFEDMFNKKIVFVEQSSSSGYYYPMSLLLSKNIDPNKYFKRIFFAGSHDRVISAVEKKSADVGTTYDRLFEQMQKKKNNIFNIILQTKPIPNVALCASSNLDEKTQLKLLNIMLAIKPQAKTSDGRLVFDKERGFPSSGFVQKSPSYYNFVRITEKRLNALKSKN